MVSKEVTQLLLKQAYRLSWSSIKYPHFLITPTHSLAHGYHCSSWATCPCFNTRCLDLCSSGVNLNLQRSQRLYSHDTTVAGVTKNLNPTGVEKKKLEKKPAVVKILLINETGNYLESTLEDATKIARKKGLQLILDTSESEHKHKDRKVYRLKTNAQYFGSDFKKPDSKAPDKQSRKEDKTMILKSRISEHDVLAKVKQIIKLAEKGHHVRVFIGQSGSGDSDSIYKIIETNLGGSCKIEQKVAKGGEIKFKVVQSKEVQTTNNSEAEAEVVPETAENKKKM